MEVSFLVTIWALPSHIPIPITFTHQTLICKKAPNQNFHSKNYIPFKELFGYNLHLSKSYPLTRLSLNPTLQLPEGALYKLLLTD